MKAAVSARLVGTTFAVSAIFGATTALRAVVDAFSPPVEQSGETWLWFIASLAVVGLSVATVVITGRREAEERRQTKRERACQAQRDATIFSETLLILNVIGAFFLLLPSIGAGPAIASLATHATLTLVVASPWYLASTVPYAPLPRLKGS